MNSPTITSPAMTQAGMILGTAAYMSPEQAPGKPVDKRADIWAFGVVLYEMLTGTRLFAGDSVPETLGLIFSREPDLTTLPTGTPARVRTLIARCLVKDPAAREHDKAHAGRSGHWSRVASRWPFAGDRVPKEGRRWDLPQATGRPRAAPRGHTGGREQPSQRRVVA
jgi:serine/threonine protein kinase